MSSAELQLVSKIIKTGDLKSVLEWGITPDDFLMLETQGIYKQILAIYLSPDTTGSVIGPRLAQSRFTHLNLNDVDDHVTIAHLCFEVRQRRIAKELKEKAQQALEIADANPMEALSFLQQGVGTVLKLDAGKATDVDFSTGMDRVYERYLHVANGGALGKFPWPWGPLQEETQGLQEDDYVVFYGRPKSMKSWVLSFLIAFFVEAGWIIEGSGSRPPRVLVYTKEMTPDNIYQRIAATLAGLPYGDFRKAKLDRHQVEELKFWVAQAKAWAGQNRLIVLSAKDVSGRDTVAWLQSKVEKYAPDIVFIDGIYLMSPENPKIIKDNEKVASISRAIRQMILHTKVPVIATIQANRKAAQHGRAELDEIAFSDAVSQDATMLIRVINDKMSPTISLVFGGAREFMMHGMRIHGIPASNFSFHSSLTERDILEAKMGDAAEDDDKKKKNGGRHGNAFSAQQAQQAKNDAQHQKMVQQALNSI